MLMIAAVLATISVADVDACSFHGRLAPVAANMNVMTQPHDGRDREGCRRRMENVVTVVLFDEDRAAKPKANRTSDADGSQRFVRKIQQ